MRRASTSLRAPARSMLSSIRDCSATPRSMAMTTVASPCGSIARGISPAVAASLMRFSISSPKMVALLQSGEAELAVGSDHPTSGFLVGVGDSVCPECQTSPVDGLQVGDDVEVDSD